METPCTHQQTLSMSVLYEPFFHLSTLAHPYTSVLAHPHMLLLVHPYTSLLAHPYTSPPTPPKPTHLSHAAGPEPGTCLHRLSSYPHVQALEVDLQVSARMGVCERVVRGL